MHSCRKVPFFWINLLPPFTLKLEVAGTFKAQVPFYHTTRHHILKDGCLHIRYHENFKSCTYKANWIQYFGSLQKQKSMSNMAGIAAAAAVVS
jgi:hypothetical protein